MKYYAYNKEQSKFVVESGLGDLSGASMFFTEPAAWNAAKKASKLASIKFIEKDWEIMDRKKAQDFQLIGDVTES